MNIKNHGPITYLLDNIPPHNVYIEPDHEYRPRDLSWKEFERLVKDGEFVDYYLNEETTKALRNLLGNVPHTLKTEPVRIDPHVARHILVARLRDDGSLEYFSLE